VFITTYAGKRSKRRRHSTIGAAADNLVTVIDDILHSTRDMEFSASTAGACML